MPLIKNKQTNQKRNVAVKYLLHNVCEAPDVEGKRRRAECQSHALIKYKSKETNLMKQGNGGYRNQLHLPQTP